MDGIDQLVLTTLTPGAIACGAVWAVLTGRLVPRWLYRALERERDHWRETAQELSRQQSRLLTAADTSTRAIEALTQVAGVNDGGDRQ